jgi:exopolysaccharide biosynthesis polyprenyl glycosylphosphotransferase
MSFSLDTDRSAADGTGGIPVQTSPHGPMLNNPTLTNPTLTSPTLTGPPPSVIAARTAAPSKAPAAGPIAGATAEPTASPHTEPRTWTTARPTARPTAEQRRGTDRPVPDTRVLQARHQRIVVLADFVIASVAIAVAIFLRFDGRAPGKWALVPGVLPLVWVAIVALHHAYEQRCLASGQEEFVRVVRSGLVLFMVIAVSSYASRTSFPRSIVLFCVPVTVAGALAVRQVLRMMLARARDRGRYLEKTVVVGSGDAVVQLVDRLKRVPRHGMLPVGVCLPSLSVIPSELNGVPVLGGPDDVLRAVEETDAHVVAIASYPDLSGHPLRQLSWALEERGVDLIVSSGIVEVAGPRLSIRPVDGLSLLHLERPAPSFLEMLFKAGFDRLLGALILVVLSPVLLALAVAIKLTSPGPVLFRQVRVGEAGREFSIYKFRSMVVDAEHRLIHLAHRDEGSGVLFKIRTDPRVTRIGARLRKYSLDELPQLINVTRGEMSLVGPRPPLPSEVALYTPDALRRLRMRPGMTGLWQVSGRSDLSWEQSLQLDLHYVDNWRMSLDLAILWRTVRVVLTGSGAY